MDVILNRAFNKDWASHGLRILSARSVSTLTPPGRSWRNHRTGATAAGRWNRRIEFRV